MPKTRKMLTDWNAPNIQSLMKLIETQSKPTLAHWARNVLAGVDIACLMIIILMAIII